MPVLTILFILSLQLEKVIDFDYSEEHLRIISNKNFIMAVSRKEISHSVDIDNK